LELHLGLKKRRDPICAPNKKEIRFKVSEHASEKEKKWATKVDCLFLARPFYLSNKVH
jgi:hypothetical protein